MAYNATKMEAARKHYANVIDSRRSLRKEKTAKAMDKYTGMISQRRAYGDQLRKQAQYSKNREEEKQRRLEKQRNSVWSNIAMLGTSVGAMFGPIGAAVGGLAGAGLGMGMAAARGGDPFDFGAQLAGLDPSMAAKAAISVGGAFGHGPQSEKAQREARATAMERAYYRKFGYDPGGQSPREMGYGFETGDWGTGDTTLKSSLYGQQAGALQSRMPTPKPGR